MAKKTVTAILIMLFVSILPTSLCVAQQRADKSTGYAPVNGQKIYYEIHGAGKPIILLHGAYMTINLNWAQLIPGLSKTRKVIALELQGHGHTALSNRALSFDSLADDVEKTMKFLKIDSADIVGYSFGGTVAYNLAIKYPNRIAKLIIISSTYKYEGWQKEVRDVLNTIKPEFLSNTPLKSEYAKVAPDSSNWDQFVSAMIEFDKKDFNLGDNNIKNIKAPVLLISGDNDGIDKSILIQTYQLLGGCTFADMTGVPKSQLAIVPGQGHVSLMMQTAAISQLLNNFLK
jgi:pimeloyl-ACP methyl ester carboxylesterase